MATKARLEFGDKGFVPWNLAKSRFIKDLHTGISRDLDMEGANLYRVDDYIRRLCPELFAVRIAFA